MTSSSLVSPQTRVVFPSSTVVNSSNVTCPMMLSFDDSADAVAPQTSVISSPLLNNDNNQQKQQQLQEEADSSTTSRCLFQLTLRNCSDLDRAFKMRSTNPTVVRVAPSNGIIGAQMTRRVQVEILPFHTSNLEFPNQRVAGIWFEAVSAALVNEADRENASKNPGNFVMALFPHGTVRVRLHVQIRLHHVLHVRLLQQCHEKSNNSNTCSRDEAVAASSAATVAVTAATAEQDLFHDAKSTRPSSAPHRVATAGDVPPPPPPPSPPLSDDAVAVAIGSGSTSDSVPPPASSISPVPSTATTAGKNGSKQATKSSSKNAKPRGKKAAPKKASSAVSRGAAASTSAQLPKPQQPASAASSPRCPSCQITGGGVRSPTPTSSSSPPTQTKSNSKVNLPLSPVRAKGTAQKHHHQDASFATALSISRLSFKKELRDAVTPSAASGGGDICSAEYYPPSSKLDKNHAAPNQEDGISPTGSSRRGSALLPDSAVSSSAAAAQHNSSPTSLKIISSHAANYNNNNNSNKSVPRRSAEPSAHVSVEPELHVHSFVIEQGSCMHDGSCPTAPLQNKQCSDNTSEANVASTHAKHKIQSGAEDYASLSCSPLPTAPSRRSREKGIGDDDDDHDDISHVLSASNHSVCSSSSSYAAARFASSSSSSSTDVSSVASSSIMPLSSPSSSKYHNGSSPSTPSHDSHSNDHFLMSRRDPDSAGALSCSGIDRDVDSLAASGSSGNEHHSDDLALTEDGAASSPVPSSTRSSGGGGENKSAFVVAAKLAVAAAAIALPFVQNYLGI